MSALVTFDVEVTEDLYERLQIIALRDGVTLEKKASQLLISIIDLKQAGYN